MSGGGVPRTLCLICGRVTFPGRLLCMSGDCAKPKPGEQPKTEWGRIRKAQREAAS